MHWELGCIAMVADICICPHLMKLLGHAVLEALVRGHVAVFASTVHKDWIDWGKEKIWYIISLSIGSAHYIHNIQSLLFNQTNRQMEF